MRLVDATCIPECDLAGRSACCCETRIYRDDLLRQLENQQLVVDSCLTRPARWRGPLRRDLYTHGVRGERERYAQAFDELTAYALANKDLQIDSSMLCETHDRAVGGRVFRKGSLCAGRHDHVFPEPEEVPDLLGQLFERLRRPDMHPVVAATLAHLDLLTIHPFRDGNGRTARLLASVLLVRAGFRSSLFTAVEQFYHCAPTAYIATLDDFDAGRICHENCIARFVHAMVTRSSLAVWFRTRQARILAGLQELGVPEESIEPVIRDFELGTAQCSWSTDGICVLNSRGERPWHVLKRTLSRQDRVALVHQLRRLRSEIQDDGANQQEEVRSSSMRAVWPSTLYKAPFVHSRECTREDPGYG